MSGVHDQIKELQQVHVGLDSLEKQGSVIILSGTLSFAASTKKYASITDHFEIEITIPKNYPKALPKVKEIGERISRRYTHLYRDGTLCLTLPWEEHLIFIEKYSLLNFVNRLVIPYFFTYCHWEASGKYPVGEWRHDLEGLMKCYRESFKLPDAAVVLKVLHHILKKRHRITEQCPCGSGKKVYKCHQKLRVLCRTDSRAYLKQHFAFLFDGYWIELYNQNLLSLELLKQFGRQYNEICMEMSPESNKRA